MLYFLGIIVFICLWLLLFILLFTFTSKDKSIEKLKYFDDNYKVKEGIEKNKKEKMNFIKNLSQLVPNTKLRQKRYEKKNMELIRADMPITVDELLVIKILLSISISFLFFLISKGIVFSIIIFIFLWNVPFFIISSRKKKRIREFDEELNEGVMIISNSLKAGYSFLQSVSSVAEETKDPFSKEFKKLFKEMSLGISEEIALRNLNNRMQSKDLSLVVNAILIQKDIGGNLSEILDNIAETIRERQKMQEELKTLTAQGKLSGIIVMAIPIFLGLIIYIFNKEYILLLFNNTIGLSMVVVSIISQVIGLLMIRKIINIDM